MLEFVAPLEYGGAVGIGAAVRAMYTVERRRNKRVATLKSGLILLKNGGGGISCIIRNWSPIGACLELANHFGVPLDIILVIAGERFRRPCRVIWRGNKQIGVVFN